MSDMAELVARRISFLLLIILLFITINIFLVLSFDKFLLVSTDTQEILMKFLLVSIAIAIVGVVYALFMINDIKNDITAYGNLKRKGGEK